MATNFQELELAYEWDAVSGSSVVRMWDGPSDQLATFLGTELPQGFSRLSQRKSGKDGWMTVTATYSAVSQDGSAQSPGSTDYGLVNRDWQLLRERSELPIQAHQNVEQLSAIDRLWPPKIEIAVAAWRDMWSRWIKAKVGGSTALEPQLFPNPTNPSQTYFMPDPPAAALGKPVVIALANEYARVLSRNPDQTFNISRYLLRKTETVMSWTVLRAVHSNVHRVFTLAGLLRSEPTLAQDESYNLIHTQGLSAMLWQKLDPTVEPLAGGKWQITSDYSGVADYLWFLYGTQIT